MKPCGVDRVYNSGPEIGALDMITKAPRRVKDKVYYDGSFSLGQDFIEYTCESIWRSDQTYPSYRRMYCQTNSWDVSMDNATVSALGYHLRVFDLTRRSTGATAYYQVQGCPALGV
jgi:hypothetical protein